MTPEQFTEAGQAIFGPCWQKPMAEALGMSVRHVGRMASGKAQVSNNVHQKVAKIAWEKSHILRDMATKMTNEWLGSLNHSQSIP